jgi:beta-N-acetylhexosaminidase
MTSIKKIILLAVVVFVCSSESNAQQLTDSLEIKIGQMILMGFPKAEVDSTVLKNVREGRIGSIIIFEKNIPPKNSFAALKKITWTYQEAAPIPLLIGIDQEGGRVNRLKDKYGFSRSITAEAMGKASSLDSVRFYGETTAATLAGLGINVNFAPVVDLAANPTNPIIAKVGRAFSNNEDSVGLLAKEFIKQHRKYGVLTSLKHFPGHGSSKDDTHLGLADVTTTWTDRELKPYQILIDSGYIDAVMSAHIVNKNLDKQGNPGTLSRDIVNGILRNQLHFNGVVFSDDMHMQAVAKHFKREDAIRLALNAGIDIICFTNNVSPADQVTADYVISTVKKMVLDGEIKRERIDESYRRIMKLKSKLATGDQFSRVQKELAKTRAELNAANAVLLEHKKIIDKANRKKKKKQKKS